MIKKALSLTVLLALSAPIISASEKQVGKENKTSQKNVFCEAYRDLTEEIEHGFGKKMYDGTRKKDLSGEVVQKTILAPFKLGSCILETIYEMSKQSWDPEASES